MQTVYIGTTPVLLASANERRNSWTLEFSPSSIIAGNTGLIYIGRGFIPVATKGDPNQGDIMNPGAAIAEQRQFIGDTMPYKGQIWAVSDTASQQCTFDEQSDPLPAPVQTT